MKRAKLIYIFLVAISFALWSCGSQNNASEEVVLNTPCATGDDNLVTEEPEKGLDDLSDKDKTENSITTDEEIEASSDPYVGVYNDPSINEPNLKIEKDKDDVYWIQIGLYRLTTLKQCKGVVKSNKLEFSTNEVFDDELKGEIILNGDIAEVSFFGDEWLDFAGFNYQEFEKISEVPYDLY